MALWRAKQATVKIAPAITNVSATVTIENQLTSAVDWSGEIKNIEISGAESDVESVFLFGADGEGRQNADVEESNMTMREFTATMVYKDEDAAELVGSAAVAVGATGYNRIQADTTRSKKCILVKFTAGSDIAVVALNNAYFTKVGDISLDAEGHAEQEVMAKSLAKDYFEESNIN
jgi:hypothetical protein